MKSVGRFRHDIPFRVLGEDLNSTTLTLLVICPPLPGGLSLARTCYSHRLFSTFQLCQHCTYYRGIDTINPGCCTTLSASPSPSALPSEQPTRVLSRPDILFKDCTLPWRLLYLVHLPSLITGRPLWPPPASFRRQPCPKKPQLASSQLLTPISLARALVSTTTK